MKVKFARMVAPLAIVFFAFSAQAGTQDGVRASEVAQPDTAGARRDFDRTQQQMGRIPDMDEAEAAGKVKLPQRVAKKDKMKDGEGATTTGTDASATTGTDNSATAPADDSGRSEDSAASGGETKPGKKDKSAEKDGKKKKNKPKKKDGSKGEKSEG